MINVADVGEPHGLLFDYDLATIERLLQMGDVLGLSRNNAVTIGYTVNGTDFDTALERLQPDREGAAIMRSNNRLFGVVELGRPLIANICQVEVIEAKTPIPEGMYVGVNQLHYVVSLADYVSMLTELSSHTRQTEQRPGGFYWIRVEAENDTHLKIRNHTAMDFQLHALGELAARLGH